MNDIETTDYCLFQGFLASLLLGLKLGGLCDKAHSNSSVMSGPAKKELDVSKCPVSEVVVYLDRADVTREVKVELSVGENEIVVKQLSNAIDSDSIRVEGRGCATIGEVKYQQKQVATEEDGPDKVTSTAMTATKELERERDRLTDTLSRVRYAKKRVKKQRKILEELASQDKAAVHPAAKALPLYGKGKAQDPFAKKKVAIETFPKLDVTKNSSSAAEKRASLPTMLEMMSESTLGKVVSFMEFYSTRTRELDERLSAFRKERDELKRQIQAVEENLLLRGSSYKTSPTGTTTNRSVSISVTTDKACTVSLLVSYVVMDAGWQPQYDLRVFSKDHLLKIHYFAIISQSTGEDWEDATLVLSTAQPSIGGSPPELGTKKLSFFRSPESNREKMSSAPVVMSSAMRSTSSRVRSAPYADVSLESIRRGYALGDDEEDDDWSGDFYSAPPPPPPDLGVRTAEVKGTVTSTAFEIPRRTTIPADKTGHKVSVAIIDLEPKFDYETVPKVQAHAFLKAQVKNSSQYALLKGPANVFLDNNFISKTSLSNVSPYEDFTCSLGVDPAIRVLYKPVRRFKENTGILSKYTLATRKQAIEIKNTRLDVIRIKLTDTVPRSVEEKIKVNLVKPEVTPKEPVRSVAAGTVKLTKENLLEWQLEIPASSQHTVEFSFTVEHPAQETVTGL
ncbi:protein F37C4.5-like [Sycon ciliatum]|uniref:protein F37C4.5-like n=1 Tax=Sycon ciliatum TaxID=27933 RepID=UPI0031F6DDD1